MARSYSHGYCLINSFEAGWSEQTAANLLGTESGKFANKEVVHYLMFSHYKANAGCAVADIQWNEQVASKQRRQVCSEPRSTVEHIRHNHNARTRQKFESFNKMPMQGLRL